MSDGQRATDSPRRSLKQSKLLRIAIVLINAYAVGLISYLFIRLIDFDRLLRFWPVALFSNLIHLALPLAILLLPVALIARHRISVLLLSVNALAAIWLFGGLFMPHSPCSETLCPHIRVMTLNLGSDLAEATPERVEAVIRASDADVIGLQEVNTAHAAMFDSLLRDIYPHQIVYAAGEGTLGVALLSRFPIRDNRPAYGSIPWLPYLAATVDAPGRSIFVMTVHPPPPRLTRDLLRLYQSGATQDMYQFAELGQAGMPAILLGDLNATDQSEDYAIVASSGLRDAFREAGFGFGFTYPANKPYGYTDLPSVPLIRIDYVWHTHHFEAARAWVGSNVGSDHLPVLAELYWIRE